MFADLIKRLTAPEPEPISDEDARHALGCLLVRLAKADGDYDAAEIQRIDRVLARRFDLDPVGAARLRATCEEMEREAPDTVRFTRAIKEVVPYEDREGVVEALWDIVLADGVRDEEEDSLMRMVAPMLGVTDRDSALARQRVEARRG